MNLKRLAAVPALALALAGGSAFAQTNQSGLVNVNVANNNILNNVNVKVDIQNVLNNNNISINVLSGGVTIQR